MLCKQSKNVNNTISKLAYTRKIQKEKLKVNLSYTNYKTVR